ncbi:hypothetical protein [Actinocrispum wychmicini]|uniref:Magnesium chelatase subunit D n=1 Tax=Actinocrispum wychmicini TaxID=1213861 RepID=A0A4V2S7H0_9PSEU|nr:hypothetical protein [Actinocrispum wychmicini]TCO59850.1 magnesium chelatase subunit D [Actinocrispum wychmicini]
MGSAADPLTRALTVLRCVAAEPGLGGVLLLDLDPSLLLPLGRWLADSLAGNVVLLGSSTTEEDLWLRTRLAGNEFSTSPGLLAEDPAVVVVPDLCRAGLPVTRAAVTLVGADCASAEVLGHSIRWRPRTRWLAAADRGEVGHLSPHLLDRFPIRVDAADLRECPPATSQILPARPLPMTPAAVAAVVATMEPGLSPRRELTLARVARALAAFDGADTVQPEHVAQAADLLGVTPRSDVPDDVVAEQIDPPVEPADGQESLGSIVDIPALDEPAIVPARYSGPAEVLAATAAFAEEPDRSLYPEDDPQSTPKVHSLRAPGQRRASAKRQQGHAIGVRTATRLHDLAIVATVLEAAKYQAVRRRHATGPRNRLIISPADLRRHRRRPQSGGVLVLVLDHSCRQGWDWSPAIAPYLRWAYEQNAAVSVIEFGHRATAAELNAERFRAASLLDPRLLGALNRLPGLASPLAHALDLALHELRGFTLRGRMSIDEAVLVVVTDGRGNVPLDASLRGRIAGRTGRLGITDALTVAAKVRTLARVRPVVITPGVDQYPELPYDLADAMGGKVIQPEPDR